jgi:DNA-binding NarL/FixJ family response regulator
LKRTWWHGWGWGGPVPNVCGCGVNEREVWDLVKQQRQLGKEPLVMLTDSIAADQGRKLMRRLMQGRKNQQILLLVEDDHWLSAEALAECRAQAIVHVESFGSGTLIRALQALRRGGNYLDPRLQKRLQKAAITLTGREQQMLEGLSRSLTNKAIAKETGIAATTVRDYLSQVSRKLGASNRTDALARAAALGLVRKRGDRRPA